MPAITWGDGHADQREHVINEIRYGASESWLVCRCDEVLIAGTPNDLAAKWRTHGPNTTVMSTANVVERGSEGMSEVEMYRALNETLETFEAACTCATMDDIWNCPNYQPGDEAEGAFDDE